ncbi:MAG: zinc ribbon domain-containing protein [Chthoniobacterales bacterium]|nr:zinc ribbon domain-containing protein [Chthoniobacterales bacterium]
MKLICPECRRENEAARIYCHDCGARLDRSSLAKEKQTEEDPKDTQRRLRGFFDGRRALMRQRFFRWSKLILGALALAAVVQMLRLPDLPEAAKAPMLPAQISMELENAAASPRATPLQYTDEQVNAYLAYTLKSKQAALSKHLNFERAVVSFGEGYGSITAQRSLFGHPVSTTAIYSMQLRDGALHTTARGGSIGRLPVHPLVMQYAGFLFADLRGVLQREQKSITKLGAVEFHEKTVSFLPKQSAAPAPAPVAEPAPAAQPTRVPAPAPGA